MKKELQKIYDIAEKLKDKNSHMSDCDLAELNDIMDEASNFDEVIEDMNDEISELKGRVIDLENEIKDKDEEIKEMADNSEMLEDALSEADTLKEILPEDTLYDEQKRETCGYLFRNLELSQLEETKHFAIGKFSIKHQLS